MYNPTTKKRNVATREWQRERLKNWLLSLPRTVRKQYVPGTADKESSWGMYSMLHRETGRIHFFHYEKPLAAHVEHETEYRFISLIDGKTYKEKRPYEAWAALLHQHRIGIRKDKTHGYRLNIIGESDKTGTYSGKRMLIKKGYTYCASKRGYATDAWCLEDCPNTLPTKGCKDDKQHNFVKWISFKGEGFYTCSGCQMNYYFKESRHPETNEPLGLEDYERIHHPAWHIVRKVKKAQMFRGFAFHMPGAVLWYDNTRNKIYVEVAHRKNNKRRIISIHANNADIPSYTADIDSIRHNIQAKEDFLLDMDIDSNIRTKVIHQIDELKAQLVELERRDK